MSNLEKTDFQVRFCGGLCQIGDVWRREATNLQPLKNLFAFLSGFLILSERILIVGPLITEVSTGTNDVDTNSKSCIHNTSKSNDKSRRSMLDDKLRWKNSASRIKILNTSFRTYCRLETRKHHNPHPDAPNVFVDESLVREGRLRSKCEETEHERGKA
jgi:hypothetical protein